MPQEPGVRAGREHQPATAGRMGGWVGGERADLRFVPPAAAVILAPSYR